MIRSSLNNIRKPFNFISVARNTVPGMAKAVAQPSRGNLSRVKNIPRTRFNGSVSPHRVFDAINVPLDDVKKIKNVVPGATVNDAIDAKAMTDYTQFIPSMLTAEAARLSSRLGLANRMNPQFNCTITNVPGPPIPLYSTGAKLLASYGTGPVGDGLGLFHAIGSYCGQFMISATSCREMMPDPAFYRQCLQDSFDAMLAAANLMEKAA